MHAEAAVYMARGLGIRWAREPPAGAASRAS
jgi:hypothetical protein